MLDLIRNNVQSFGVKFIVGVVILVMTFFGISAYRRQGVNTIATIDGYEIKVQKYQRAYERAQNEIRQRYKRQASAYMKMINLPARVVQQLVNNALLLKSAERLGLSVTDYELAKALFNTPAFQTDKRFDPKKYEQMLASNRIDRLVYEKDLRENLLTQKYLDLITSGVLVSHQYVEDEYRRFKTEMTVEILEYKPEIFTAEVEPTAAELNSYYENHKSSFQQKKQFAIKYFQLNVDDADDKVIVRDKEIARYYDRNKSSEFSTRASYSARHILIPVAEGAGKKAVVEAKNQALQLYQQLQTHPERFPELARKYSADPASAKKGGKLGWIDKGKFLGEFETVVERLDKNEISQPFRTRFGFHIVQLLDRKAPEVKPLASVRSEIEKTIQKRKATRRLHNKVAKIVKQFAQKSLAEIASENKKDVVTSQVFDDAQNLKELGQTYQLYEAIKDKKLNDKGYFNLNGKKSVIVYEITKVVDPFIKPLKDVKQEVEFFARSEKAKHAASEKLKADAKTVTTKAEFERLARRMKIKPQEMTFTYADPQSGQFRITDTFRNDVYRMKKNQVKAVFDGDRDLLVYLVDKKEGEIGNSNKGEYNAVINQLKRQKANILISGLIGQLRNELEVKYNQSILKALDIKFN